MVAPTDRPAIVVAMKTAIETMTNAITVMTIFFIMEVRVGLSAYFPAGLRGNHFNPAHRSAKARPSTPMLIATSKPVGKYTSP